MPPRAQVEEDAVRVVPRGRLTKGEYDDQAVLKGRTFVPEKY
jgi:hypothetical protein